MMGSNTIKQQERLFFIKIYGSLWQLEQAIQALQKIAGEQVQLSVLGKFGEDCISNTQSLMNKKKDLKEYWKGSLGDSSEFALFCNPEIGTLFIAGSLVSQFIHDMDGKMLGEMTSGPYGILRGLGITKKDSALFLKALNDGSLLLILRAYDYELKRMEALL